MIWRAVLALILSLLLARVVYGEEVTDPKSEWGLETCHTVADWSGYDDCTVWLAADGGAMTITFHCAYFDPEQNRWVLPESLVVRYEWTETGVEQLDAPAYLGCPTIN